MWWHFHNHMFYLSNDINLVNMQTRNLTPKFTHLQWGIWKLDCPGSIHALRWHKITQHNPVLKSTLFNDFKSEKPVSWIYCKNTRLKALIFILLLSHLFSLMLFLHTADSPLQCCLSALEQHAKLTHLRITQAELKVCAASVYTDTQHTRPDRSEMRSTSQEYTHAEGIYLLTPKRYIHQSSALHITPEDKRLNKSSTTA